MKLPERYKQEYEVLQKKQLKPRVALFIRIACGVYYGISVFYFVRYLLGNKEIFRPREFYDWIGLLIGSSLLYFLNAKSSSAERSKKYAHVFSFLLLIMIARLGYLYPASALVFSFYFTLGFIIAAFTVPWTLAEIGFLALETLAVFTTLYGIIIFGMGYSIPFLPRFHGYYDGTILIVVAAVFGVVLRRQRIKRDLENFLLLKEIEEKNLQIKKDLEFANRIHRTLIPESIRTPKADIMVNYLPVSYVGGDYAKFYFWKDDALLFFICDVTGHGVAAALMVNRIHAEFDGLAKEGLSPAEMLQKMDEFIEADFAGTGMFLSAFCGRLDFKMQKLLFSNYGHPPQFFHQTKKAALSPLAAHTTLLGIPKGTAEGIYQSEMDFESGDRLLLFTDGIPEAASSSGERFGAERLEKIVREHSSETDAGLNETVLRDLEKFAPVLSDDVLLLSIHIH